MSLVLSRRVLLRTGLGGAALGVVTLAAGCSSDSETSGASPGGGDPDESADGEAASTSSPPADAGEWARVNLGFVSAYVLVREGQAAVVDTGEEGSEADIEEVLTGLGLDWGRVSDVVLTHSHGDHIGSAAAVARAAPDATFHAGGPDIPAIDIGREVSALDDGDQVMGMTVVATPGHTPGHIALHDTGHGVLVAGDALVTTDGRADLPVRRYSSDHEEALRSVTLLGGLDFETLYVGHGEPVMSGASAEVAALG